MPITDYLDVAFDGTPRLNLLSRPIPVLDAAEVSLRAFRFTDLLGVTLNSVQPGVVVSSNAGFSYGSSGVLPDVGSLVTTGFAADKWIRGPWVWNIDWDDANFRDKTHLRLALAIEGTGYGFGRVQLEYSVKQRPVVRVPCYRRVIANAEGHGRWRLTDPIRPHVEAGNLRATLAVHALNARSGTGTVRPIWFYSDSPGDETAWTYGGSLHDSSYNAPGTYTTRPVSVAAVTDHPLIAFGFEILRSGGTSGHTVFALVEGTFALY